MGSFVEPKRLGQLMKGATVNEQRMCAGLRGRLVDIAVLRWVQLSMDVEAAQLLTGPIAVRIAPAIAFQFAAFKEPLRTALATDARADTSPKWRCLLWVVTKKFMVCLERFS